MTVASRPALATLVAAAVVTLTAGCVFTPPNLPTAPNPAPETSAPAEPAEPTDDATEPAEPTDDDAAPTEGPYEITAEGQDGSVWSFEVTDSRVVEADSGGDPAEPGFQLVEVLIDAQLLEGDPNFYFAFHVYLVDDATGDEYGLSTGSSYYAEDDLFTVGLDEEFTGGVGIFHVPASIDIDHVRVTNDQGGSWDFTR